MPSNPRCCARCNSSGGSSSKEVHWLSVLFWWVTDPSLMLLSQSPWEIVDLFNSLYPHHPLSGHLNPNNVNTRHPPQAPRVQKCSLHVSPKHSGYQRRNPWNLWNFQLCLYGPPRGNLGWIKNDRGTTHFFQRCLLILIITISLPIHWNVKCCNFFKIAAMKHDFKTELEPPFKSAMPFKRRWPSVSSGKMQPHWEQLGNPGSTSGRSIFSSVSWSCITWNGRELRERLWRLVSLQTAKIQEIGKRHIDSN